MAEDKELKELKKAVSEKDETIKALEKASGEKDARIEELEAESVKKDANFEELKTLSSKKDETIADLTSKLAAANDGSKDKIIQELTAKVEGFERSGAEDLTIPGTVEIDEKEYRFVSGYKETRNLKGEIIPSEDALKDIELMTHLVKIGYAGVELAQ